MRSLRGDEYRCLEIKNPVANVFASYFVSKFLFEWVLGKRQVQTLSI